MQQSKLITKSYKKLTRFSIQQEIAERKKAGAEFKNLEHMVKLLRDGRSE